MQFTPRLPNWSAARIKMAVMIRIKIADYEIEATGPRAWVERVIAKYMQAREANSCPGARQGVSEMDDANMDLYNAFRVVQLDRLDLDDAVALLSFGRGLKQTYTETDLEVPAWVNENLRLLERDISDRRRDLLRG